MVSISPSRKPQLWLWLLLIAYASFTLIVFVQQSLSSGEGVLLMPLDDVYIHFQYARQLALGDPYVYNPGQPPTSGATSFIYPYILAIGYVLGFEGLNLGWWALIVGGVAFLGFAISLWMILDEFGIHFALRIMLLPIILINGSFLWHFASGMETGILLALMGFTLWSILSHSPLFFAVATSLLALTRPEGSIMAFVAVVVMLLSSTRSRRVPPVTIQQRLFFVMPIVALFIQPIVNAIITGSFVASGNQSKSILSMIPHDTAVILGRIIANLVQMLSELMTGFHATEGWYTLPLIGVFGVVGLGMHLRHRRYRAVALLVVSWLILVAGAVATLDNAFWHFKRYQMPLQLLLMIYALLPLYHLLKHIGHRRILIAISLWGFTIAIITVPFVSYYALNTRYVYQQPYQMALWLKTNTPQDAVVAVHDVGMMRYWGERTTLDIVGLTSPNASTYWRNGPGSVAELIQRQQPDYIASYGVGHGYGLAYLADTDWYSVPLAEFALDDWQREGNVALAAPYQAIYKPDWQAYVTPDVPLQPYTILTIDDEELLSTIDVADVLSEQSHQYEWRSQRGLSGFASIVYQHPYIACVQPDCDVLDGGRVVDTEERFVVETDNPVQYLEWVMRVHPVEVMSIGLGVVDSEGLCQTQASKIVFQQAGYWLEIAATIDLDAPQTIIKLCTQPDGAYQIYTHWIYDARLTAESMMPTSVLATYQHEAFALVEAQTNLKMANNSSDESELLVDLVWYHGGNATGDFRFFLHIYDELDEPPVAQIDRYSMQGTAPPADWHTGRSTEQVVVNLSNLASQRTYRVAIGFYDPRTSIRLQPENTTLPVLSERLFIGSFEIP